MYKIVFSKAELMKCIADSIVGMLPTWAIFDLMPQGLCIQSLDGCHQVLLQLVLRAEGLEEYKIDKPYALGGVLNTSLHKCYKMH